jgi:hypothetical protein
MMTAAMRDSGANPGMSNKISEDALIGEMKGGRNVVIAVIAIAVAIAALVVYLLVR